MATSFQNAQLLREALSILDGGQEKGALTVYNGDPNGNVTGTVGALCIDYSGSGKLWKNSNGSSTWVEIGVGGGGSFTSLTDTPSSYTGEALKAIRVNAGENALEFYTPSGSGSPYFDDDGGTPTTAPSAAASDSIAIGDGASVASGATNSLAIGTSSSVSTSATNSLAIGTNSKSTVSNGVAIGRFSYSTNTYSVSIGTGSSNTVNAQATGGVSLAIGAGPKATGGVSIAIGYVAKSNAGHGVAIGSDSRIYNTSSNYSVSIGRQSQVGHASTSTQYGIAIGRSAQAFNASLALSGPIAIGRSAVSSNNHSIALGNSIQSSGQNSIAIGRESQAATTGSIAIGRNSQAITNTYSIAIGSGSTTSLAANATGSGAISIGNGSDATNGGATAIGKYAQATGAYSTAISGGFSSGATASGINAIAIGQSTVASGNRSLAMVQFAQSVGTESIAIGRSAQVKNTGSGQSISIGYFTTVGHTSWYASNCVAIGPNAKAYSTSSNILSSVSIGSSANVSASASVSIGASSNATNSSSVSIGAAATNSAQFCVAIGAQARGRVAQTAQIQGGSISQKDDGTISITEAFRHFSSSEAIVMSNEVSLTATGTITINVPTNSRFYPNEVGVILTSGTLTGNPTIGFGITGNNTKFVTTTTTTLTNLYDRDVFTSLTTEGESSLTAEITAAGTGTSPKGRFYFKGMLVENQ